MLYGDKRDELRRQYCEAWRKHREQVTLSAMEQRICDAILDHPEYHAILNDPEQALNSEFPPEAGASNPFLHMGLHIAIREQLATDRPAGVRKIYADLLRRVRDAHALEHQMMECLAEGLWHAQRDARAPDEAAYLECLRGLAGRR